MPAFRFIHSSDLHLGRRFSTYPEDIRGRLVETRHSSIDALAAAARDHEAGDIFIAGDLFDTETPSERVWRQALAAMGAAHGLRWWIIPGNHDSLAAEALWKRFTDEAPESVRVVDEPAAVEVTPGVSARDRYVEPVLAELDPLVRLLWPEAALRIDADEVLPAALERQGTEEHSEVLSGGTQEQIALLVRLAFARMLARGGASAPVIFDDAIVFTDDDRIERMFDALTRQAQDIQIIVLSCRQRAFRDLGGRRLEIESATAHA